MSTRTIDLNRFKNAVGFTATFRCWGNRRKGNIATVKTSDDAAQDQKTKQRIKITKQLIVCKEYDAIVSFMGDLKQNFIYANTVPSFFKEGFQLTGLDGVEPIEARMRKAQGEIAALVSSLVAVFPAKIDEARTALGDQFNASDYPSTENLRRCFSLEWNWIAFTVPEGLPAELRKAEEEKLEKQFADAGEQILQALRAGFGELIGHAVERLTVNPGDKPKIFKDSLIGNIQQFIDTFNQRNLLGDVELAKLVAQAKDVLACGADGKGINAQRLRDYANVKENTLRNFAQIKGELDKMIAERPSRKFDFEDEAPAAEQAPSSTPEPVAV